MRITDKEIFTDEVQGSVVIQTGSTTRVTYAGNGSVVFAADAAGGTIRPLAGGTASITAATASTDSASALSGFRIAHGLASTPTIFAVEPANVKAALANGLGAYRTADATYVYFNTLSSVTAASAYNFNWLAAI